MGNQPAFREMLLPNKVALKVWSISIGLCYPKSRARSLTNLKHPYRELTIDELRTYLGAHLPIMIA